MGTNVYAIIENVYTDSIFQEIEYLAKNHDIKGLEELNEKISNRIERNTIHIGKRSGGWKFLFDHNNWKYYDYTKCSIIKFLKSCHIIRNEYGDILSIKKFWDEYVEDFKDGFDGRSYYEDMLNKSKMKSIGIIKDFSNIIPTLSQAEIEYKKAMLNNWYEETNCKGIIIPKTLKYRFSIFTDFE
jgi:hypothetical protein